LSRRTISGGSEREREGVLEAAPGLARIAAGAWVRTASWYADTAVRAGRRLTDAVASGESPVQLAREARSELLEVARQVLGVTDLEQWIGMPARTREPGEGGDQDEADSLRHRGARLLERSEALEAQEDVHPAFDRILTQLSPDEARILRLLATEGAQASVDVRTWRPLGIGSRVVAPGLSMIGRHAGCMRPDRVPVYLANLYRLGLIWFSRDPLPRAIKSYQVLEAQPEVVAAAKQAGRAQIKRRSVRMTPFGEQFCEQCLPLEGTELPASSSA
jgi:hypothetical protein